MIRLEIEMELLGMLALTLFTVLLAVLIAGAIVGAGMIGMTGFIDPW